MQTFLPYPNFKKSAECLDYHRLGKQRVEAWQILCCLDGKSHQGWKNHPVVLMWKGKEDALVAYGMAMCEEWIKRGYKDTMMQRFLDSTHMWFWEQFIQCYPKWFGLSGFHSRHRAALLAKDYKYYSQFGWKEKPEINYFWPVTKENK